MEFVEPATLFQTGAGTPSRGLLDVRAPVEVAAGALPFAVNLPILSTAERHRVGLRYKEAGQRAAVELGEALTRDDLPRRVEAWREVCAASPTAVMCWRGGLRSQLAQDFIGQASSRDVPRVRGGYKALRRHLMDSLEPTLARKRTLVVTGLTGAGKTDLLAKLRARAEVQILDLEAEAAHRGSAFGLGGEPQPSQATFENSLAAQLLLNPNELLVVEDESRSVGRRSVPGPLFEAMQAAPLLVLETSLEDRVQRIFRDYIARATQAAGAEATLSGLIANLTKLRPRLGNAPVDSCLLSLKQAYEGGTWLEPDAHRATIRTLLEDYYDPLYRKSVQKLARPVLARGTQEELAAWLETPSTQL